MNKLISRNPVQRFKIQYYLGGTPKGGINLGIKSKKEIESNNNRERNLAFHHFSKVFSDNEGIWDGIKHLARGILHGYNGYLDPETLYLTGAPTILPGRTPTKVPSVKKVGNMLKNKLFLRGYNRSGVKISAVPRSQVPDGETITFFKNANGTRTPKYYDKKYGHWIEVIDDVDDDVKVVGYASNASAKPTIKPITNYNNDTLIVSNIEPYDSNNDIIMINSAFDDAYNYDPGLLDLFKKGGILPSRNPVLRFKLGRKITKFYRGGIPNDEYVGGGTKIVNWLGNLFKGWSPYTGVLGNKKSTSSTPKTTTKSQTTTTPKALLNKTTTGTGTTPPYELSSDAQKVVNERNKRIAEVENLKGNSQSAVKKQPINKTEYDDFLYAGKMGGWNKSIGLGNIKDLESLDIIKQLGWEGKSAEEVLKLLNSNDIGGNRVVVDNKWGNQSKAALQNYYNRWLEELKPVEQKPTIQLPEAPIAPTLLRQAISDYSNYAQNLKQALGGNSNFSGLSNLVWKEYADDDNSFAANFSRDMRTRFKDYGTLLSWLDNQAAIEKLLNISGRYRGTNSGDYGDIANSMANWAGGYNYNIDKLNLTLTNDYNKKLNYYNTIIDKYKRTVGGYKMGGLLPSRNVIERFKLGRKIIFAKGGAYFPVTVGGRTYQYNPYNGSYKGTQGSGLNISYKDIEGAFNKQYEGVSHSGSKVYRKRGSHTTWTNSAGKQVNLAPAKKAQPNTSFKTSANGRFRVVDLTSGKELRFDSRDEAKKYQMSAPKQQQGTRVIYDDEKESKGQVIRVDRTKEKATEYGRKKLESNNNLSFKQAYQEGRNSGNKYFSYKGKVYKTDLENGKNNMDEMIELYGNNLGYSKDPNLNNKKSVAAREQYRKDANAKQGNRNANYKGKTNSLANAEADKNFDKELGLSTLPVQFTDAMAPLGNLLNLALTLADSDYKPEITRSGLNPFGYVYDAIKGNAGGLGTRALDLTAHFGLPGARTLMVKAAPKIPVPTYLQKLYHGDASSTNWVINGLNRAQGKVKNFFTRMVPTKGNGHFGTYSVEASEHISPSVTSVINNGANQYITRNPNAVLPLYTKLANTVVDPRSWHITDWVNDYSNNNY